MLLETTILITLIGTGLFFLKKNSINEVRKQKLIDELNELLHKNYDNSMDGFIRVFESRLLTLEDEEGVHFYDVGVIEYNLFNDNLNQFASELKKEINEKLKNQYALASDLRILHKFTLTVDNYISSLIVNYSDEAMRLLTASLLEINTKNTECNTKVLSKNRDS